MFYVDVREHEAAVQRIRYWLDNGDRALACLVSASYFEWCLTRFLLIFSDLPLEDASDPEKLYMAGAKHYKNAFNERLKHIGLEIQDVVRNWRFIADPKLKKGKFNRAKREDKLKYAYVTRHELVHGRSGTVDQEVANFVVGQFLEGINYLKTFAEAHDESIFRRLARKRDPKNKNKTLPYIPSANYVEVLAFLKAERSDKSKSGGPNNQPVFDKRKLRPLTRIFQEDLVDKDLDLLQRRLRRAHFPCKLCSFCLTEPGFLEQLGTLYQNTRGINRPASVEGFDLVTDVLPPLSLPSASQAQS